MTGLGAMPVKRVTQPCSCRECASLHPKTEGNAQARDFAEPKVQQRADNIPDETLESI